MPTTDASVFSIIAAFTSAVDICRKLRDRRRKRRSSRQAPANERTGEELRLSKSLRKGPIDIQREYERNVQAAGERYAVGDTIAQASLAETLLKLNTGLVSIISSFLGSGHHDAPPDYKSLTKLSDSSRVEALDTLGQLYQRVSQSTAALQQLRQGCPSCGSLKHSHCRPAIDVAAESQDAKPTDNGRKNGRRGDCSSARGGRTVIVIKKVPISNTSGTQLTIIRPRKRRTASSSTTSSNISGASSTLQSGTTTARTTPCTSPLLLSDCPDGFPFPEQAPPVPLRARDARSPPPQYTSSRKPVPDRPPCTTQTPQTATSAPTPPPPPALPPKLPAIPSRPPTIPPKPPSLRPHAAAAAAAPPPIELPAAPSTPKPNPIHRIAPRRLDKLTPSFYSFASDSTKLGEIPMRKWTVPYDHEAMEVLNEEARAAGWRPGLGGQEGRGKPRSRFMRFLRGGG